MNEFGGYIELDKYQLPMLHKDAVALNCGRNCLAYVIRARKIKKIFLPYFLCDSVKRLCEKENVSIRYYHINNEFVPYNIELSSDEWLYIVNYYGQINNEVLYNFVNKYKHVIVDNAQAYFQKPLDGVDTIYTCRKFFGVPDGAFLYTDRYLDEELSQDVSFDRMRFLLGRFERNASEFYEEYVANNDRFMDEPIKVMSKLTNNLLHAIDYKTVKEKRTENFAYLHENIGVMNKINIHLVDGAFMYPLFIKNAYKIRKQLQIKKIYIPTLWLNVLREVPKNCMEYQLAENTLPIACDQRYNLEDLKIIVDILLNNC